jgi:hypothetical protein
LGFSQITRMTPFRFTILHLSQIFFTEALTFILFTQLFTPSENPAIYGEDGEKVGVTSP